jgi:hypothetical protein
MGDLGRTHRLRSSPQAQTRLTHKAIAPRPDLANPTAAPARELAWINTSILFQVAATLTTERPYGNRVTIRSPPERLPAELRR